jgi:hypothetical protein
MNYPTTENQLVELYSVLQGSAIDKLLFHLAENAMRQGGHRYGAFLDAATTAAKLAIYMTYLEEQQNLRRTGNLHHLEPKRVKAIVQEVQYALKEGRLLKILGSQEPSYLINLPHLWQQLYPCPSGSPRLDLDCFTSREKREIEENLPRNLPDAQILTFDLFLTLLEELHNQSQDSLPEEKRVPLSEALADHIELRLLRSGTVLRIESPLNFPLYVLAQKTYSPVGRQERTYTLIEDVDRFFQLMQAWVSEQPDVLRALEMLNIHPEQRIEALQELSDLVQAWADKYHDDTGELMVLQMVAGPI